ncbi:von Willebrand factor A domain-containing protein DDB_G0286969-like isoform X2 [Solanum tuberosum]|nr:PREDICTED: von Willebrand factor A domain-containing protein DDB_G0286969-like isoform X1 [Solanum tuberosum]XP_015162026.1 PREDICTED: von Willebrand factor A domain-containing protein DDB_G0286969-like isoform X2 [Solanum tuberosum]
MEGEFVKSVEDGVHLAKRIYFGKDRAVAPPKPMTAMEKASLSYLPESPMLYAVIGDPAIVDNPDIPSYQPHVHGRCDPPALIPLQMNGISLEADCYLDTAFITVTGSWRVHCVMGSRSCDCRIAVPMGEQGSILGVEVELPRKSYSTKIVTLDDESETEKVAKIEDGCFLKPHIFTLSIPQVDGGTNISVTIRWSQKLLYCNGQLTLDVPFSFPDFVTPAGKKISKKEKIQLNVNSGPGIEVICKSTSHPLKERQRQAGKLGFFYESDVLNWSRANFVFSYAVSSSHTYGNVLLQSPPPLDSDQREIFCCSLFPGDQQCRKVFRKEVVFVVDISGSMKGKPIEDTKQALCTALSKLDSQDLFNIIAFNSEKYLFSSSLELATKKSIENATQWIGTNFIAGGGTNILNPLTQAMEMFSYTQQHIPIIFLVTDGAVEDERHICNVLKSHLMQKQMICPRLYTFGIGLFCNHYFLRMLAVMSRGHYNAAYDVDSIEVRVEQLFSRASSVILANIAFENLDGLEEFEVFPTPVPDLSSKGPLVLSGRYRGVFPDTLKAKGVLADLSNFSLDLKAIQTKDIPLDKVLARQQIELLTAQAWLTDNKDLEQKIAQTSIQNGVISEYTRMILIETDKGKVITESTSKRKVSTAPKKIEEAKLQKKTLLQNLGAGFGNYSATIENISPGITEKKPETAEILAKAASNCCGKMCDICCCMCCIRTCSKMNDQCAIVLTQFLGSLACLGCFACCELCCSGNDG